MEGLGGMDLLKIRNGKGLEAMIPEQQVISAELNLII